MDFLLSDYWYNFERQQVHPFSGQATAFCSSRDKFFVALKQNTGFAEIHVFTVEPKLDFLLRFSTDLVTIDELRFSEKGNYILCKGRDRIQQVVCVFLNWWIGDDSKHRTFSSLSHSSNSSSSSSHVQFEALNLTQTSTIYDVTCCPRTGNVAINLGFQVSIYQYEEESTFRGVIQIRFHQILRVQLRSLACRVNLVENYLSLMYSRKMIEVIKITTEEDVCQRNADLIVDDEIVHFFNWHLDEKGHTICLSTLLESQEAEKTLNDRIETFRMPKKPGVNSGIIEIEIIDCEINSNVTIIDVKYETLLYYVHPFKGGNLLAHKLTHVYRDENSEDLDPLSTQNYNQFRGPLLANDNLRLICLGLFISTTRQASLYRLVPDIQRVDKLTFDECAQFFVVNADLIYVLTEKSIQVHGSRLFYQQCGLRNLNWKSLLNKWPFICTQIVSDTESHLIIVSKSDSFHFTIYALKKPSPYLILQDIEQMIEICDNQKINILTHLIVMLLIESVESRHRDEINKNVFIRIGFKLVKILIQKFNSEIFDVIDYVFNYRQPTIDDVVRVVKGEPEFVPDYLRVLLEKNEADLRGFFASSSVANWSLLAEEIDDPDLVSVIVMNVDLGENGDKTLRSLLNRNLEEIVKIKAAFDASLTDDAERLLRESDIFSQMCHHHQSLLPLTKFSRFLAEKKGEIFMRFLISRFEKINDFTRFIALIESDRILCANFIDRIYWHEKYQIDQLFVCDKLLNLYFEVILNDEIENLSSAEVDLPPNQTWLVKLSPQHRNSRCSCFKCKPCLVKFLALLSSQKLPIDEREVFREKLKPKEHLNNDEFTEILEIFLSPFPEGLNLLWNRNAALTIPFVVSSIYTDKWQILFQKSLFYDEKQILHDLLVHLSLNKDPKELIESLPHRQFAISQKHLERNLTNYQCKILEENMLKLAESMKNGKSFTFHSETAQMFGSKIRLLESDM